MSTTITVKKETKKLLERLKGKESWDTFLRKMALNEYHRRKNEALKKLRETNDNRDIPPEEAKLRLKLK